VLAGGRCANARVPAYDEPVLTVGVDLAAEPARTAVAWIDWSPGQAFIRRLEIGADDDLVVAALLEAEKAGIDCPFGWPDPFVDFVRAHQSGDLADPETFAGTDGRRQLAYRATDLHVRDRTGLLPLSVAADRIGHTAMRCAGLLARLGREGRPVDRRGSGVVVEVYPAASLKYWGLPYRRYKRPENVHGLGEVVDALQTATPWLRLGHHEQTCRRSDDAFDAVIAGLTARAASLGLVEPSPSEQCALVRTEGWIALPDCQIDDLMR
jgi:predicted nuclease with RNAse H fold